MFKDREILTSLLNNLTDVFYRTDREGRIVWVSPSAATMLGYGSVDELIGRNLADDFYAKPEYRKVFLDKLSERGQVSDYEIELLKADGSTIIVSTNSHYYKDENGEIGGVEGVCRDITGRKKSEVEFLQRDEELSAIIESSVDGILVVDRLGKVIHSNRNFAEMWRIPEELINTRDDDTLLNHVLNQLKDPQAFLERVHKLYESPEPDFDTLCFRDGRVFERYSNALIIDGRVAGRVWNFRDVTGRIKAEEALIESEKRYRALFEQAPDSIMLVDGQTGEIVEFNDKACENLGYARDEFRKLRIHDFDVFESEDEVRKHISNIMERGYDVFETKHRKKDGEIRDMLVSCRVISFRGRSLSQSMLTDITDRKRAEESVLSIARGVSATTGEKFFYSLVEHLSNILGADYAYIAEIVPDRPGFAETLSLIADGEFIENIEVDLSGTPCKTVVEKMMCAYPAGVRSKFPDAHIMAQLKVEGYVGTLLAGSSGEPLGLMAVMYRKPVRNVEMIESMLRIFAARAAAEIERRHYEVSLRKAGEEIEAWNRELEKRVGEKTEELRKSQARLIQSEKFSAMGQLAAGLAHELNSPLSGLLPLLKKYREKAENGSEAYRELTLMLKAGEHMAKIVKDFGSFSRDRKSEFSELNLNEVIEDTLSFSASQLKQRGIKVVREYADAIPMVKGDKTELQQVVLNMVTNARDAMPDGGEFLIRTGCVNDGKSVKMEFIDNGQGISREVLDKIFDPFFTTKKHGEGVGLGLPVSYNIVMKHNGDISAESEPGRSTKFTIVLPCNAG